MTIIARPHLRRRACCGDLRAGLRPDHDQDRLRDCTTSHYGVGTTAFCDDLESARRAATVPAVRQLALGGEREMIEAVQLAHSTSSTRRPAVGNFVPEVNIVDIRSCSAITTTRGACSMDRSAMTCAPSSRPRVWWQLPGRERFRHMTNSKRPIVKPTMPRD